MPKNVSRRGPSQEERRRRSANRPIGGGGTPQQLNNRKKDESYSNTTRVQKISGIIGIIMLVALLLSLVPACYYSQAGAAELPGGYSQVQAAGHLTVASVQTLEKFAGARLTSALTGPTVADKLSPRATRQ